MQGYWYSERISRQKTVEKSMSRVKEFILDKHMLIRYFG